MEDQRDNCVYAIYCTATGQFYIGRTNNPANRFKGHLTSKASAVYETAKKHGKDSMVMLVLKRNLSYEESKIWEAFYIYTNYFRLPLLNRFLPMSEYLLPFVSKKEDFEKFSALLREIDEDLNSENPRIYFPVLKNKSNYQSWWENYIREKAEKHFYKNIPMF